MNNSLNLGIVFPIGGSLRHLEKSGQKQRFLKFLLPHYQKSFSRIDLVEYQHSSILRFVELFVNLFTYRQQLKKANILRGFHVTGGLFCLLVKLIYKKPYTFNYGYRYDLFADLEKKSFQKLLFKLTTPLVVRQANFLIAATPQLADYLKQNFKPKKVVIIPNGVNTKAFSPGKPQLERFETRILNVGRLVPQKNQLVLIKAIANSKHRSQVKLTILGQGPLESELIQQAKKLKVKLKIINSLPNHQLPKLFHQNDIFILPSIIEGHPKALLEAMSCGLPVVTTSKINQLTKKFNDLIDNPKKAKKLGAKNRGLILEKYNLSKLLAKEIDLLKSVILNS
jgi:glycosyltransferase involved in cell wall biosynthesis